MNFSEYVMQEQGRVAAILSKIKGAGRVDVMITYASGIEYEYAYETKTQTIAGVTTTTTELVYSQGRPIVINEKAPKIKGVVVVAQGAGSPAVRMEILKAVQTLLNVGQGQIEIFAAN
jgi:stage III sporulation protein AG